MKYMAKKETHTSQSGGDIRALIKEIEETFTAFKVPVEIEEAVEGLRQYHFYLKPVKPTRMKAFKSFEDDLRYALSSDKVYIEAPIPDSKLVGITVPKKTDLPVMEWSEAIKGSEFKKGSELVVPLGVDEFGGKHLINIARMPHVLIGGTTGSGKSTLINSFIASLITKNTPDKVRFIMIDPKRVELTIFNGIPHLLTPVITDAKKGVLSLKWAIKEMERRYDILQEAHARDIEAYQALKGKDNEPMPYIVIVFDEIADLMQLYPNEYEASLVRLAQMGRAVGIHLIIATQRPSVNVITGILKANIPVRIGMKMASQIDSRTILDMTGAEKLDGAGDMLFLLGEMVRPERLQSYWINEEQIKRLVKRNSDDLSELFIFDMEDSQSNGEEFFASFANGEEDDDLYEEAKQAVMQAGKASTSYIQRKLRIGYSRAARLMDLLEEGGVIGPQNGSEPRKVLIDDDE